MMRLSREFRPGPTMCEELSTITCNLIFIHIHTHTQTHTHTHTPPQTHTHTHTHTHKHTHTYTSTHHTSWLCACAPFMVLIEPRIYLSISSLFSTTLL